jgi:dolichol-phosphate mannosyltransferase
VLDNFPRKRLLREGFDLHTIVIDNASGDDTACIAREAGATVLTENNLGKGNAMRLGFASIPHDTDYVVMIDGDNTYHSEEILRMIEPLEANLAEVVLGSRLAGHISEGAMTLFNRGGNWIFSHLVRFFYHVNVTDVLTGYYAWTREALERLHPHLTSDGFSIEMEMITKMARLKEEIISVPITYSGRSGESNLRPIRDGIRILIVFLRNLFWKPYATPHGERTPQARFGGMPQPADV